MKKSKKKTNAKIEKCLKLNPSMPDWKISEKTKLPRATVQKYLASKGYSHLLQRKPSATVLSRKLDRYLSKPENQNKKSWQVAEEMGISHQTICRYAKNHPSSMVLDRMPHSSNPHALSQEARFSIYALFQQHPESKVASVARENGVTRQAVDQLLKTLDAQTGQHVRDAARKRPIRKDKNR